MAVIRSTAGLAGTTLVGTGLILLALFGLTLPLWLDEQVFSYSAGDGELEITQGGASPGTATGTRLMSPTYLKAGTPIPPEGTAEAALVWKEDLCDGLLDCSSCPPQFDAGFNSSTLTGSILVFRRGSDERLYLCGMNRISRAFGGTGIVGLAYAFKGANALWRPGFDRNEYRLGEEIDCKPRGGDFGIPFPHVSLTQRAVSPILEALEDGDVIHAVMRPTTPNPFVASWLGAWVIIRVPLLLGHLTVAERSLSFLVGHILANRARVDLAQMALLAEGAAHVCMSWFFVDPFNFYWGSWPQIIAVMILGPTLLCCCSTLLLAAYWHQMVVTDGLASVAVETQTAAILAASSIVLGAVVAWFMIVEVFLEQEEWLKFRLPGFNCYSYVNAAILASFAVLVVGTVFVVSASRAKTAIAQWANPAAGKKMMRRVRLSGALSIGIVISAALSTIVMFNPVAFQIWCAFAFPLIQWNSRLQIDSFRPQGGAPTGPLQAALRSLRNAIGTKSSDRHQGATFFAKMTHQVRRRSKKSGASAADSNKPSRTGSNVFTDLHAISSRPSLTKVAPESVVNTQDQLSPCHRLGLSLAFLEAFASHNQVTPDMTTQDVCEQFIKPFTKSRSCVYQDLIVDEPDLAPPEWLGKTTHFASHW